MYMKHTNNFSLLIANAFSQSIFDISGKFHSCALPTDDKTLENGIFDLKHSEYNQEEFSWMYSDGANDAVQNVNKTETNRLGCNGL